jgi:mono/diheme cytochrome c family protein
MKYMISSFKRQVHSMCISALAVSASAVYADAKGPVLPLLPKYQQECAACHMAYPAGMLPAASWKNLMGGLTRHYGTDASLDEASVREISTWLNTNAGTYKRVNEAPPKDRITQSAWFLRKHNEREVPAGVWKRVSVGGASNCVACHAQAAQGSFSERDIRIPK